MGKRFAYALEPVLLSREWALQDQLAELAARRQALQAAQQEQQRQSQGLLALQEQGRALMAPGTALRPEQMMLLRAALTAGARRSAEAGERLERAGQAYAAQLSEAGSARRALDVAQRHRAQAWQARRRELAAADYRDADESWVQPRREQE